MTAGASYHTSEKMCNVQHQPHIPRGTEAIPRVRCSRPQGSEQKERCRRFGLTPTPACSGVGVHQPWRGSPNRCSEEKLYRLESEFGRVCERRKLRVNVGKSKVMGCSRYGNVGLIARKTKLRAIRGGGLF